MILVTGGTGNVGANVVRELLDAGEEVRVLSREPGRRSFPDGVQAVAADLARPESLPAALAGVERAFLMAPAFADIGGFLTVARQAGLRHVVLLSSLSVLSETPGFIGEQHQRLEKAVLDSGLPWTFLRPGAFMTNDLAWAPQIVGGDVVRGVYPNAEAAPVDPRDIAGCPARGRIQSGTGLNTVTVDIENGIRRRLMATAAEYIRPARGDTAQRTTLAGRILRGIVTAHMVAIFGQPVFAGIYLSGDFDGLRLHEVGANIVTSLGYGQLIAASVVWIRLRRAWVFSSTLALVAAETVQYFAGMDGALWLHLPLGVATIVGVVVQFIAMWMRPIGLPARASHEGSDDE